MVAGWYSNPLKIKLLQRLAVDTADDGRKSLSKTEEVRKPEEPSLPSTLDSGQTEGVQPSDMGNEPVKESGNEPDKQDWKEEVISLLNLRREVKMIISSLFLIPKRK